MTLTIGRRAAMQQQVLRRSAPAPVVPHTMRRFTVWSGSSISPQHRTIEDLARAVYALVPAGVWDQVELLLKAGEGGSWQSAFDSHPLAPRDSAHLAGLVAEALTFGLRITPYVVTRGRSGWIAGEQAMVSACVAVAGRCVLNTEPGSPYWNGPNDPAFIRSYIRGCGVSADALEVCMIPRAGQVAELGGAACIQAWTDPALVGSASWETYGVSAGQPGPTSLLVNEAIPRLDGWGVPPGPQYRIPVCQRSELSRWADTQWAAYGLACWYLDGD